jgi:hypothetical protein
LKRNTFQDCSVLAIFGDDVHDAGHLREPLGCLIQVAIGKLLFTRLVSMFEKKNFFLHHRVKESISFLARSFI